MKKNKKIVLALTSAIAIITTATITVSTGASAPNEIVRAKYMSDDGLYKVCDGHTMVYIWHEFGGLSGNSLQVALTSVKDGC